MASVFSHPAPALALAVAFGARVISPRLAVIAVACSLLPDLDVAGFKLGIPYAEALGHRGLSHSLVLAVTVGLFGAFLAPLLKTSPQKAFLVLCASVLSHIALDAMTTGGLGVAFFWPMDETRYFLPWRPIEVSPLSPRAFFSERGLTVILSELRWIWLPCAGFALCGLFVRRAWKKSGKLRSFLRRTIKRSAWQAVSPWGQ